VKVPPGYIVDRVLSPGPATWVARARSPTGEACVLKVAAVDRATPALANEADVLRALTGANVGGVPRLLHAWPGGIAIEWLALPTLRDAGAVLRESRTLRDEAARVAFVGLADIHAARDAGGVLDVVHGDISPDNLYVASAGETGRIADFGLATWRDGVAPDVGVFRGTLAYASPEAARAELLDGRADDFALAASLLHVATGIALRQSGTTSDPTPALLVDAGTRPLDASHPWRTLAPQLFDGKVADALLSCLAFDRRDRPRETPRPW
jgi:serine/threonine protein kinase, bacterial